MSIVDHQRPRHDPRMMPRPIVFVCALAFAMIGCSTSAPPVPVYATSPAESELTLVWVGHGEAERFDRGRWLRVPEFDYEFSVEQRRYADHWESIKSMRRHHPGYDGSAGPRAQTLFFRVAFGAPLGARVPMVLGTSLGAGTGQTDREFREATLDLRADVSRFAPFDAYRIEQHYRYEEGMLDEMVTLTDAGVPWVRNRERAALYASHRFDHAPTVR